MKRLKIFSVLFVLPLFALVSMGADTSDSHELMLQKAYKYGNLRVILEMEVPGIEELTEKSILFKTGDLSPAARRGGFDADLNLERGITDAGDRILHKLNNYDYRIVQRYSSLPFMALSVSPESLQKLFSLKEVLSIHEDKLIPLPEVAGGMPEEDIPGKPQLSQSTEVVGAEQAWGLGITGSGWYVAVLDTGIRPTHEFFTGKDIVEACFSAERDCPNGQTSMVGPGSAEHYYEHQGLGGYDHGTHVAGIAAGNNRNGKAGVSKDSDIIAIQVFSYFPSDDDILSWSSDQLKGLEHVYSLRNTYRIASVNISIGGGEYGSFCNGGSYDNAIKNLKAVGIAVVIATGNEYHCNGVAHPSCYEAAIATGATTKTDVMVSFSNWKKGMVDLFAPGYSINSAIAANDTSYNNWNGTSMAAPHVAGAWGLLKQMDMNLTVNRALQLLQENGKMVNTTCPSGGSVARINVGEAIQSLLDVAPPLNFTGERFENRALLQTEYFVELTWDVNPFNASKGNNITEYQVFRYNDGQFEHLGTVGSDVLAYRYRKVSKTEDYTFAVKAVTDSGKQSVPGYVTVQGDTE